MDVQCANEIDLEANENERRVQRDSLTRMREILSSLTEARFDMMDSSARTNRRDASSGSSVNKLSAFLTSPSTGTRLVNTPSTHSLATKLSPSQLSTPSPHYARPTIRKTMRKVRKTKEAETTGKPLHVLGASPSRNQGNEVRGVFRKGVGVCSPLRRTCCFGERVKFPRHQSADAFQKAQLFVNNIFEEALNDKNWNLDLTPGNKTQEHRTKKSPPAAEAVRQVSRKQTRSLNSPSGINTRLSSVIAQSSNSKNTPPNNKSWTVTNSQPKLSKNIEQTSRKETETSGISSLYGSENQTPLEQTVKSEDYSEKRKGVEKQPGAAIKNEQILVNGDVYESENGTVSSIGENEKRKVEFEADSKMSMNGPQRDTNSAQDKDMLTSNKEIDNPERIKRNVREKRIETYLDSCETLIADENSDKVTVLHNGNKDSSSEKQIDFFSKSISVNGEQRENGSVSSLEEQESESRSKDDIAPPSSSTEMVQSGHVSFIKQASMDKNNTAIGTSSAPDCLQLKTVCQFDLLSFVPHFEDNNDQVFINQKGKLSLSSSLLVLNISSSSLDSKFKLVASDSGKFGQKIGKNVESQTSQDDFDTVHVLNQVHGKFPSYITQNTESSVEKSTLLSNNNQLPPDSPLNCLPTSNHSSPQKSRTPNIASHQAMPGRKQTDFSHPSFSHQSSFPHSALDLTPHLHDHIRLWATPSNSPVRQGHSISLKPSLQNAAGLKNISQQSSHFLCEKRENHSGKNNQDDGCCSEYSNWLCGSPFAQSRSNNNNSSPRKLPFPPRQQNIDGCELDHSVHNAHYYGDHIVSTTTVNEGSRTDHRLDFSNDSPSRIHVEIEVSPSHNRDNNNFKSFSSEHRFSNSGHSTLPSKIVHETIARS